MNTAMLSLTCPPPVDDVWPELHDAIYRAGQSGQLQPLRDLLQHESDLKQVAHVHSARDMSVLHTAVTSGLEVIDLLMDSGADVVLENRCSPGEEGRHAGQTPLQLAVRTHRDEVARRLIHHGADYDLFSAVALGDIDRVTALLDLDPDSIHATDRYEATLLHWAVAADQLNMATLLLQRGIDVGAADSFDETPLLVASVRQARQREVMRFGFERGISIDSASLVEPLLECGAGVDEFSAAALGDVVSLQKLLKEDSGRANNGNSHGTTPLHWAARNGQLESARLLLREGAHVDAQDAIGCSPLWYAAYWGRNAEMTHFLCQQGADVASRNIWKKDVLSYDCGYGCSAVIRCFQN